MSPRCPHGIEIRPVDWPNFSLRKRSLERGDFITSMGCDICFTAWQLHGPDLTGYVTEADFEAAKVFLAERAEAEREYHAWKESAERGLREQAAKNKGRTFPRARCPVCGRECAVQDNGFLYAHYPTQERPHWRARRTGRRLSENEILNLQARGQLHSYAWRSQRYEGNYCPGREVWYWTSWGPPYFTMREKRAMLIPMIALAVWARIVPSIEGGEKP